jgi:signal transduction histidine kinase/CheY-like chemotaxis protein
MTLVAILSGMANVAIMLKATHEAVDRVQAQQIEQIQAGLDDYLLALSDDMRQALAEADATTAAEDERRRVELYRLLRQRREIQRLVLLAPGGAVDAQLDRRRADHAQPWPELIDLALAQAPPPDARPRVLATLFVKDVEPRAVIAARNGTAGRYLLLAEFSLEPWRSVLSAHVTGFGGSAVVLDRSGRVLARSEATAGAATGREQASPSPGGSSGPAALLRRLFLPPQVPPLVVRQGNLQALNAQVVVQVEESIAFAPVARSLQAGLVILLVTAVAAMTLSWLLSRRISQPLRSIQQAAFRIGRGEFDHRVDPAAHRELAPLARSLNDLAAQIGASHALLERRVEERTLELTVAKQLAERSDEAKSRFIAAASHDLRQPLHAVSILAALIALRAPEGELRQLTVQLQSTVESLESFFVELLDISRLDMGHVTVTRQTVDLGALLQRIRDRFSGQDAGDRLRVRVCRLHVDSDPVLLERIVQNLVSNALKHAGEGSVLVTVRRRTDSVHLEVHDQGPGIPEDQHEHIFEEFVRLPRQNLPPGLGLGLSIVRRFSVLLGHAVTVRRSRLGGACFTVALPRAEPVAGVDPAQVRAAANLAGLFVLVIDDDPGILQWTRAFLGACGCHTEGASSAAQARDRLKEHMRDPDVILSDYDLPHEGFEAVLALRDELDPAVPIVLVSGDLRSLGHPQAALAMAKPVSPAQLSAAIAHVAQRHAELTQ